jgi:hypothetical protein
MENEVIKYWFDAGILFSEYKGKVVGNYKTISSVIQLRNKISNNQNQYWCYDIRNLKSMDLESRKYADKYGQDFLYACAVIVNSPVTQFIFNVFLNLKSPKIPFKSFYNEEEAVDWLKKIKQENESVK